MNYIRTFALILVFLLSADLFAGGGMQLIFNKTDKTVVVELGDFFPTPYRIAPGSSTIAYVSTDRQNIIIRSAE